MKAVAITRQLSNLISNKSILEDLNNELKNLLEQKQRVQENLTWESEEFETQISWLKKVDEIDEQVRAFLSYFEGKGTCTNFMWRYKVGKKSAKMRKDISQLYEEGKYFLSIKPAKDYKGPKSRPDTIHDIMEALKNPDLFQTVGVWGLGGVSTTSIAKQVGEQAKEQNLFDSVVVIKVTEKPKVKQVQEDIATELIVHFDQETLVKRRNKLRQRMKNEKILVIVDDKWGELNPQEFDLEEIGIPLGDEHKGCKLLLASGNLNFIQNVKGGTKVKVFQLEVLLEDEALSLFEKMVGGVAQDSDASSIVTDIVKSCEGSTSLIFSIAKALKKKGLEDLMKLKENVSPTKLLSYSLENDQELKSLLLLLTIRGRRAINRYSIFIDMWIGLIKNIETLDSARKKLDSLISDLKAYGLLVEDGKENVKIDDFIWKTAYSIAQNDEQGSIISREWPHDEELPKGLAFCNINIVSGLAIPGRLQCPNLQQLVISTDTPSMQVPDSFFEETKLLKVLNFVGFDCSKLPNSLASLEKLEALSMNNCKLGDITNVGELTNLKVLSLLGSSIEQLPRQIGQLEKLLFLDLRDTSLQVIPYNVLSKLERLEEIYLRKSFSKWETDQSTNASLKELEKLYHLAYIEDLNVPDPQAWPVDLFFGMLKSYTIFIGDKWVQTHDGDHRLKTLKLKLNREFQSEYGIKRMLKSVDVLYLDELNGVQNIVSDLDSEGFPHLQSLLIQNNAEIKCIVGQSHDDLDAFTNLESLTLNNLNNLEHICHCNHLTQRSFFKLRVLKVHSCDAKGCLFSSSMIKGLPHLANVEVSECKSINAIVLIEGAENSPIEFLELCSLTLKGLPTLVSFCLSSQESSSSTHTPTLFYDQVCCPNLETMVISKVSELTAIWNEGYGISNSFCKLKIVEITDCEKLKTVFPVNISNILDNLKILEVSNCSSMTSIFTVMRQDNKQPGSQLSLPMIRIKLLHLPKLEYVCVTTEFELLKKKFEEEWQDGVSTLPAHRRPEAQKMMKKFMKEYLNM
ncbi:disease resistance protein At4g27190 [Cajanus cajan]|uniref:disease resistance protein At4g27190 n=1 Tax=Cajanus cajan TaxID=3821 RepID=UPI00098DBEF4|nr:disease resistance protein At4g27190 [Cajanus cajan]XP_020206262.1 disease resistance protein At4g27190 [Cajanus cajan]